jgi:hypothetical protein
MVHETLGRFRHVTRARSVSLFARLRRDSVHGMALIAVYSPAEGTIWGELDHTQTITQPWGGAKPVWIQCTLGYVSGGGEAEFGVAEVDQLDDAGNFQTVSYGDGTYGSHPARLWVPHLLAVTVIYRAFDAIFKGTLTLFLWD